MIFRIDSKRPVDLYRMLRDSLISDALRLGTIRIDLWTVLPSGMTGNRLQTTTLLRKMAARMVKEFPGGVYHKKGIITFDRSFLEFARTQSSLGTTEADAIQAWAAFKSMADETGQDAVPADSV